MGQREAVFGAAILGAVLAGTGCGGPANEGGPGAECFRAEECAAGLVCIDQQCTSDLSSINIVPEGGIRPIEAGTGTPD